MCRIRANGKNGLYYTLLHEMAHILGILEIAAYLDTVRYYEDETVDGKVNTFYQIDESEYGGSAAVKHYNDIFNDESSKWKLIPVENDGGLVHNGFM